MSHAIDTALAFGADRLCVEGNGTMGFIGPGSVRQLGEKEKLLSLMEVTPRSGTPPKVLAGVVLVSGCCRRSRS